MPQLYLTGVRLSEDIEAGALGGPRWNNSRGELDSGFIHPNRRWVQPLYGFNISFGIINKDDIDGTGMVNITQILNLYNVANGSAFGFLFKDFTDFEIGLLNGVDLPGDPPALATGDGVKTVFQMQKTYRVGGFSQVRDITKVRTGTAKVYLDTVLQGAGFTVDEDRARITFDVAPGMGVLIGLRTAFDNLVQFASDDLNLNMRVFNAGSVPDIELLEVRGNGID